MLKFSISLAALINKGRNMAEVKKFNRNVAKESSEEHNVDFRVKSEKQINSCFTRFYISDLLVENHILDFIDDLTHQLQNLFIIRVTAH